jgi:hypothetical protein
MSSSINWKVAEARTDELRRLEASTDAHPFSRFVHLVFTPPQTRRK